VYLAYVVAKPEVESKLEDIPVVRHYPYAERLQDYLWTLKLSSPLN